MATLAAGRAPRGHRRFHLHQRQGLPAAHRRPHPAVQPAQAAGVRPGRTAGRLGRHAGTGRRPPDAGRRLGGQRPRRARHRRQDGGQAAAGVRHARQPAGQRRQGVRRETAGEPAELAGPRRPEPAAGAPGRRCAADHGLGRLAAARPMDAPRLLELFRELGFRTLAPTRSAKASSRVRPADAARSDEAVPVRGNDCHVPCPRGRGAVPLRRQTPATADAGRSPAEAAPTAACRGKATIISSIRRRSSTVSSSNCSSRQRFAIDLETTSLEPLQAEIVGLAFCWQAGRGVVSGRARAGRVGRCSTRTRRWTGCGRSSKTRQSPRSTRTSSTICWCCGQGRRGARRGRRSDGGRLPLARRRAKS